MIRARLGLGALAILLFCGVPAWGVPAGTAPDRGEPGGPAGAVHIARLDYQLYSGGMHPLDFSVDVVLEPGSYEIAVHGQTKGLVDFFVRWVSHTLTQGKLVGGRAVPVKSRSLNRFHDTPRRVTIDYRDGMPVTIVEPPPQQDDRDPVTPAQMLGTIDSSSAVLELAQRLGRGESCAARQPVFDGRRRFDMVVSDIGSARIDANSYSPFAGDAHICDFVIERIAGFNRKPSRGYDSAQPQQVVYRSWSLPVLPGMPPVPVRLEGEGSLGLFHLYLVAAHESDRRPSFADLN